MAVAITRNSSCSNHLMNLAAFIPIKSTDYWKLALPMKSLQGQWIHHFCINFMLFLVVKIVFNLSFILISLRCDGKTCTLESLKAVKISSSILQWVAQLVGDNVSCRILVSSSPSLWVKLTCLEF